MLSDIIPIIIAAFALAMVSLIETALVSVSEVRMRLLADDGHRSAPVVLRLMARPQELLIGLVTLVNGLVLFIANQATILFTRAGFDDIPVLIFNLLVLAVLLVFSEITPKTISVYYAEAIALRAARLTAFVLLLLTPVVVLLNLVSMSLLRLLAALRLLSGRIRPVPTAFSEEDIKDLISAGEQSGEVEASEREMIHSVIEFADTSAYEIMVPRTELVALPDDAPLEDAVRAFLESGHSRIPVYEENVDNIVGVLYLKDILIRLSEEQRTLTVRELLRPAYFVPETKKSDELLRELQRRRVHLAIVVDEYGGTAGIITIEDLLEEIVGDIIDEYDHERLEVVEMPDGSVTVSGRASLEKIEETFDIPIPEETEAETISGLVTEQLGRIPEAGDRVIISGVEFTVIEVAHNRAERLRAVVLPEPPEA